ncbi:MAG: hypothetical protein A2341_26545 [Deltaproteobacteria bacterium RIFOXYB12_FULL_58_9]|nr:MAG: hypothetical protein A2341_26545 [Deltaproteobacteria bacterium RIFOXYB12_FULL_58_9]
MDVFVGNDGHDQRAQGALLIAPRSDQILPIANCDAGTACQVEVGMVPVFAAKTVTFVLTNPSRHPVTINQIVGTDLLGKTWQLTSDSYPVIVDGHGEHALGLTYRPTSEAGSAVELEIESNASNEPHTITLNATSVFAGAPEINLGYGTYQGLTAEDCQDTDSDEVTDTCLVPEGHGLDFGVTGVGVQDNEELVLRNTAECERYAGVDPCSMCSLTIVRQPVRHNIGIGFKAGTNDEGLFAFVGSTATPLFIPQHDNSDPCDESGQAELRLAFDAPLEEGEFNTVVVIESNDPNKAVIEIPVKAASRRVPIAIAKPQERDPDNDSAPWTDPEDIQPLERAYFDGRDSYDPRDPDDPSLITSYSWAVIEYPGGLDPNDFQHQGQSASLYSLWLPFAGHYVVQLTVWNVEGRQSADTPDSRVEFEVLPGARLRVQLTWDDSTNDQNLHLLYLPETQALCDAPWDCHNANKTPVWFASSPEADGANPHLDIDDTHGLGPENIEIDAPGPGTYRIAVHYWADDDDHSPTRNTVRFYLNGLQAAEYHRTLNEETVWRVADITWGDSTGYITEYDSDASGQVGAVEPWLRDQCPPP